MIQLKSTPVHFYRYKQTLNEDVHIKSKKKKLTFQLLRKQYL
jgi:hypothetical protein